MKSRVCSRCGKVVSGQCGCRTKVESPALRGYGRQWQKFRERLYRRRAMAGVVCGICGLAFGGESPHADHIKPVSSADDPLFYDETNIQFLHSHCHGSKTERDVKAGATR